MTCDDLLGLILAYEVFSAISKRSPLITTLCHRHRLAVAPVLVVTAAHLLRKELPCPL